MQGDDGPPAAAEPRRRTAAQPTRPALVMENVMLEMQRNMAALAQRIEQLTNIVARGEEERQRVAAQPAAPAPAAAPPAVLPKTLRDELKRTKAFLEKRVSRVLATRLDVALRTVKSKPATPIKIKFGDIDYEVPGSSEARDKFAADVRELRANAAAAVAEAQLNGLEQDYTTECARLQQQSSYYPTQVQEAVAAELRLYKSEVYARFDQSLAHAQEKAAKLAAPPERMTDGTDASAPSRKRKRATKGKQKKGRKKASGKKGTGRGRAQKKTGSRSSSSRAKQTTKKPQAPKGSRPARPSRPPRPRKRKG